MATDKVLRQIYYSHDGFDTKQVTYKKAKEIIPEITREQVNDWFKKQEQQQMKTRRFSNSYVADHRLQQVHADLADFRQGSDDIEYKYALIAVDIFSKFVVGVPMKGKTADDCNSALETVINRFGHFEELYTDSEAGFQSKQVIRLLNENKITHIATFGKAFFAETAIRTIKNGIHSRLQGLKLDADQWVKMLPIVINKYNHTVHSTIQLSPVDALKDVNKIQVWLHIYAKSTANQLYEKIYLGDKVRIMIKKGTFTKSHDPKFSKELYTVIHVSDNGYLIDNPDHRRIWRRWELRLVKHNEDKDTE